MTWFYIVYCIFKLEYSLPVDITLVKNMKLTDYYQMYIELISYLTICETHIKIRHSIELTW